MDSPVTDPVPFGEDNTIYEIGNSKVDRVKVGVTTIKSKSQNKSKGKNLLKPFSAKSQSSTQGSESGFFTSKARQAFI